MGDILEYIIGGSLIVLGLLVGRFPMLLSGYNTMQKEDRERIKATGFIRIVQYIFIWMGILIVLGTFVMKRLGLVSEIGILIFIVIIGGVIILSFMQYKYTKDLKLFNKGKSTSLFVIIFIIAIIAFIIYIAMPAKISADNESIKIEGVYGLTIPVKEITKAELLDELPDILFRNNGVSIRNLHKGYFKLKDIGNATLFIHADHKPFLIIYSQKSNPVILNRDTPEETLALYERLQY